MRIANLSGRLSIIRGALAIDVHTASQGRFASDPQAVFEHWDDFITWAHDDDTIGATFDPADLQAPVPMPRQVFAIGLNYQMHAKESGFDAPRSAPPIFTKFPTSITGPYDEVGLPDGGKTDWEVELVVVIGRTATHVSAAQAWSYVAGVTVGQDLSERVLQMAATPPQFSMGKSHLGFAPIGPELITLDELDDPDDLEISCAVNGESVQKSRTSEMIFSVPDLIEYISRVTPLLPGDLIFTGTPSGVGIHRDPPRWLNPGDELVSVIDGIGEIRNRFAKAR